MLWLLITGGVSLFGYLQARRFVRQRLRFVDAVQRPGAPIISGVVAGLAAGPIAALLPIVGLGSALAFGASIGWGVHHGARDVKRLPGY